MAEVIAVKPASTEQKPHPVEVARKILTADVTKTAEALAGLSQHEDLEKLAISLKPELESKRLRMTKEQLEKLAFDANLRALALRVDKEESKNNAFQAALSALEQRYKTLEQYADRTPQWIRKTEEKAIGMWNEFRKLPGVGDTLDWIGDMTGKAWNNAGDVWASIKGYVLGALADEKLTKDIPFVGKKVSEWAKAKLNEEAVVEGVQFAVNKAKKGQTITKENETTKAKEGVLINVSFDPKFSADDIRAWEGVLVTGNWGTLTPATATEYVDAYIKKKHASLKPGQELVISLNNLVTEGLAKNQPISVSEGLFAVPGLKLNTSLYPTLPVKMQIGTDELVIAKDSITYKNNAYKVKVGSDLKSSESFSLTARDAQNPNAIEVRHNAGNLMVTVKEIVGCIDNNSLKVKHLTFEQI